MFPPLSIPVTGLSMQEATLWTPKLVWANKSGTERAGVECNRRQTSQRDLVTGMRLCGRRTSIPDSRHLHCAPSLHRPLFSLLGCLVHPVLGAARDKRGVTGLRRKNHPTEEPQLLGAELGGPQQTLTPRHPTCSFPPSSPGGSPATPP